MDKQQIQIFTSADGQAQLEVALDRDTVWLRQEQMCELFGRERSVITKHIRNVFQEGELEPDSVCAKFAHTAADGKTYQTQYYILLFQPDAAFAGRDLPQFELGAALRRLVEGCVPEYGECVAFLDGIRGFCWLGEVGAVVAEMRTDAYTKCRGAGHIGADSSCPNLGRQVFLW